MTSLLLPGRLTRRDRPLLALSAVIFFIYIYFAVVLVWITPYPGFEFTVFANGLRVNDSTQPKIEVDDILVQIGPLTLEEYYANKLAVPFAGYGPGDEVTIITEDGRTIEIKMPIPRLDDRLRRLVATLWFFPFWLAGTAVLMFLRPRDTRWQLLIAFMYLTAIWVVVGTIANWQIGGSQLITTYVGWLLVPVMLHLHFMVPSPAFRAGLLRFIPILYVIAVVMATFEMFQSGLSFSPNIYALGMAILFSIALLAYRSFKPSTRISDRNSARLMLAGIGLAFGPALVLYFLPLLLGIFIPSTLAVSVALLSLPVLPISYTYAIYKRQLCRMEFRTNRLLGLYSFILIYPTIFIVLLLFGEEWIAASANRTFYLLFVSIIFVLATPPLLNRLQLALNRLAYGTIHNPDDILRVFAKLIPTALTRDALSKPLTRDIMPALLIRQSAVCLYQENGLEVIYAQRVMDKDIPSNPEQLDKLLLMPAQYLPPDATEKKEFSWIRLAIPLVTREETIGVWLFGRRDPDDFFPQNDIELLQTLANQLAPVVENIRLYEALQQHADSLAEEVAKRTSELRSEKDRTQAILDSAGEGIFFTDPAGVILYANPAMAQQSGYSADDLQGTTLELWQTEDDSPEAYREMWTAIFAGREWGREMLLQRKDGTYLDVSLVVAPIQSQEGELTGFVGVQSDISKLKEVDRVKSNIISSVSHELKTPLTTIKTYLMLIKRGKPEKRDGYLTVLNRETDRLTAIIQDLLDLSKLDAGKIPSRREPVDIASAVDEVIVSCGTRASGKNIVLNSIIPSELSPALADRNQIELVLTNLIVNAINYSPARATVSIIAGEGTMDGNSAVWLRVSDNGPGIDKMDLPHLFDRFYRGQTALDSGEPGTGLGLAICKEIIDRHQGKIEVDSSVGNGSVFTIWLPASTEVMEQTEQMQEDASLQKQSITALD